MHHMRMRIAVMRPKQAASEDAVAAMVESWREQLANLLTMDTNEQLPESFQVEALSMMLTGQINYHIDWTRAEEGQ